MNRIEQIASRGVRSPSLLGRRAIVDGVSGIIDAEFIDLQAAIDCGLVDQGWFMVQLPLVKTTKEDRWYSVVLPEGAVLVGAQDLVPG